MLFMRHVFFTLAEPLNNLSMLPMATAEEQEVQWPPLKHQRAHERFLFVVFSAPQLSEPADVYLSLLLSDSQRSGLSVSPPPAASPGFPWRLYTGPDEPGDRKETFDEKEGAIISGM